ncbi:1527_t:CDS:1, partial [Dentiscutata erythropus]
PAIDIMQVTLSHNNDPTTKKDARRLKRIMLTPNEWQLMDDLVKILQPFANATKMLGGSKYATMSYMFPAISSLKKLLNVDTSTQITIDLDSSNTAFDDDLDLQK